MAETGSDSLWHQEQYARAHDTIKIYNPTDKDISISWGKATGNPDYIFPNRNRNIYPQLGSGYRTVPAYIAWQFADKFAHMIVMQYVEDRVNEENVRRVSIPGGQPMSIEGEGSEVDRFRRRTQRELDKFLVADKEGHIGVNSDLKDLVKWELVSFYGDEPEVETTDPVSSGLSLDFISSQVADKAPESSQEVKKAPETKKTSNIMIENNSGKNVEELSE